MFGISVGREHHSEYRFFLDLSCIGSNESGWDHMDGESASLQLSCYCADHSQLSRDSFSEDECFVALRNDSSPTIQCILGFQNLFVIEKKNFHV